MSHIHLFTPGSDVTMAVTADVTARRLVEISGSRSVAPASEGSAKVFGAAATDAKSGHDVLVLRGGIQELVASAAIAAGDRVQATAGGKVVAIAEDARGVGIAITAAASADALVQIALD